ncbi:hypothetical protein LCGC14_1680110, partial [marine sediment metagenome]
MKWLTHVKFKIMIVCLLSLILASCLQKKSVAKNVTITATQIEMIAATVQEYCDTLVFFGTVYITSAD